MVRRGGKGILASRVSAVVAAIVLATALLVLAGCSSSSSALDGTQWRLVGWSVSSLNPADFTINADFAKGQISGKSGVNRYSGPVQVGPGTAFAAGPLAVTEMAEPEPAMRAESAYLKLFSEAKTHTIANGKLILHDQGGNESLIYEPAK